MDQGLYCSLSWCQSHCSQGLSPLSTVKAGQWGACHYIGPKLSYGINVFVEGHDWMWLWAIKYLLFPFILLACKGLGRFVLSKVKKLSLEPIYAKTAGQPLELWTSCRYSDVRYFMALFCWVQIVSHHSGMAVCQKIVIIAIKSSCGNPRSFAVGNSHQTFIGD